MCRWAGRAAPRVITCPIRASRRLASTGASSTGGCRSTIERGRYAAHRHLPDAAGVGAAGAGGGVRDPERRAPAPARDFRARARYVERRGGRLAHKQAGAVLAVPAGVALLVLVDAEQIGRAHV